MENTRDLIFSKFDKISLLTISTAKDRHEHMKSMLSDIGLDWNGDIDVHVTTPFPYNSLLIQAFNEHSTRRCFTKPNEYDCARNHYSIVRQAYDEGVERLLVIEDDIRLLTVAGGINEYIANIPDDFDVIQFGAFSTDPKIKTGILGMAGEAYYVKHPEIQLWTTSMYALSRKGMKYYLAFMDKWFTVADMPLYKAPLNGAMLNVYAATKPVAIQAVAELESNIRTKSTDNINYNKDNIYEFNVKSEDYYSV